MKKRLTSFLAAILLCIGQFSFTASAAAYNRNNYAKPVLTGDQAKDIVNVAAAQVGKSEKELGYSGKAWCAYFVSDCARIANIPTSVIKDTGFATPSHFGITNFCTKAEAEKIGHPRAGDLVFFNWNGASSSWNGRSGSHVGIVAQVTATSIITIEGNTMSNSTNTVVKKTRSRNSNLIQGYGIPAYSVKKTYNNVPASGGTYQIVSALNNGSSALDIYAQKTTNGANVHLWTKHSGNSQQFKLEKVGDFYKIINVRSGKVLDIDGARKNKGTNVFLFDYNGGKNQLWKFEDAGNGYYYIKSALGVYLDVSGGKYSNGTNIQIWTGNKTAAQKFKFVPVY